MVEINLLPTMQRKEVSQQDKTLRMIAAIVPALAIATILILEGMYMSQIGGLQSKLQTLNGEISALKPDKEEYDRLMAEKIELEKVTNVARQLREKKTYWSNDLAAFTIKVPAGNILSVDSLNGVNVYSPSIEMQQSGIEKDRKIQRQFSINGTATTQQAVIDFLNSYETSEDFAVVLKDITANDDGRYTFAAEVGVMNEVPVNTTETILTTTEESTSESELTETTETTTEGGN